jgi:hypothetical protein
MIEESSVNSLSKIVSLRQVLIQPARFSLKVDLDIEEEFPLVTGDPPCMSIDNR